MATSWKAYTQLFTDDVDTISTTVAARTAVYAEWMDTEAQDRGLTVAWTPLLPWLLAKSGLSPTLVPALPSGGQPVATTGQGWP